MKAKIKEAAPAKITYPFLGRIKKEDANSGDMNIVVLFTSPTNGTIVSENSVYKLGFYAENWEVKCFEPLNGEIILSN